MDSNIIEKIIRQIKYMKERTVEKGFTEQEEAEALAKISSLMEKYNISLSEIEFTESEFVEKYLYTKGINRKYYHDLFDTVGFFTDTKCYYCKEPKKKRIKYTIYGYETDVTFAHEIIKILVKSMDERVSLYYYSSDFEIAKNKPRYNVDNILNSYKIGLCMRVCQRLDQLKRDQISNINETGIVLYDKRKIVAESLSKKLDLAEDISLDKTIYNDVLAKGYIDGDQINLLNRKELDDE